VTSLFFSAFFAFFAVKSLRRPPLERKGERRGRTLSSNENETFMGRRGHLAGHEQVDLPAVVLVLREAPIHLGAGDVRETANGNAVHGFTVLEEAHDVVDADARALDNGVPTAHARLACVVAVAGGLSVPVHGFKSCQPRYGFSQTPASVQRPRCEPTCCR